MSTAITVESLSKIYRIPVRNPGLSAAIRSLFRPEYNEVPAVASVSFTVEPGEIVGFIGPNGAGKTTTLKMLSGLLHPTTGIVRVGGYTPAERKPEYLRQISMLMGNKTQLTWDLTIGDSLQVLKEIYGVTARDYQSRLTELVELLDLEALLPKLARNLSLGERARCELAAALLHQPRVLFLDEPTLGLDVSMQLRLRTFIREYNRIHRTTIILTSHYMSDITFLCRRVILINKGRLIFDGELTGLADKMAPFKLIKLTVHEGEETPEIAIVSGSDATVIEKEGRNLTLRVKRDDLLIVTTRLLQEYPLTDFSVEDPPIEAVMDQVYREGLQ